MRDDSNGRSATALIRKSLRSLQGRRLAPTFFGRSTTRILHKTLQSLENEGLAPTLSRVVRFPAKMYRERRIYGSPDIERRFTNIYEDDYWCCEESKSGGGSTLAYTESLRDNLAVILEKFPV